MNYSELLQLAKGWSNFIFYRTIIWRLLMTSTDIKRYYTSIPISASNMDALANQISSIYDLLIEQKNSSKTAERKNFFVNLGFCILSAIIGYLLGIFF